MLLAWVSAIGLAGLAPTATTMPRPDIPAVFQGRWAPKPQDCRDVDGVNLLTVRRRELNFYEARSDDGNFGVMVLSSRRIRIHTLLSGEGKRWMAVLDFAHSADKQTLIWRGFGRDLRQEQIFTRCP